MQEHPLIELYVSVGNNQQNTAIEQMLSAIDLDGIVARALQQVNITQPVMLTVLITDDDGIRDMNKQYRNQSKPTDVLSFPLLEKPLVQAPADQLWTPLEDEEASQPGEQEVPPFVTPPGMVTNLGDIVLSWPTIVRQAAEASHSPGYELLYLLVHGVLHLVGYDDHTEAGYQAMVHLQRTVLEASGQKA